MAFILCSAFFTPSPSHAASAAWLGDLVIERRLCGLSAAESLSKALSLKMKDTARRTICVEKETSRFASPGSSGESSCPFEPRPPPMLSLGTPIENGGRAIATASTLPVTSLNRSGDGSVSTFQASPRWHCMAKRASSSPEDNGSAGAVAGVGGVVAEPHVLRAAAGSGGATLGALAMACGAGAGGWTSMAGGAVEGAATGSSAPGQSSGPPLRISDAAGIVGIGPLVGSESAASEAPGNEAPGKPTTVIGTLVIGGAIAGGWPIDTPP